MSTGTTPYSSPIAEKNRNSWSNPEFAIWPAASRIGASNGKPSASRTSSASSANPHSGSSSPANSSASGQPWRRRSDAPTRASSRSAFEGRSMGGSGRLGGMAVAPLDVIVDQRDELVRDVLAAQGHGLLAVDEHRRGRRLAGARPRDADRTSTRLNSSH